MFFHPRNNFKHQDLTESSDGIFKVSTTNSYYYETRYDRITLPLYVKSTQSPNFQYGTLITSSNAIETLFNITLIDCNAHTSCISCSSISQCNWCSNKCVNPNDFEEKPLHCLNEASMCESFDTGTNKLLIPYTAHRQQAPLIFSLLNINNSKIDFQASSISQEMQCMFTMFNGKHMGKNITLPFGMVNKTHGHCSLTNVFEDLSMFIDETSLDSSNNTMGQVQTNLRLYNLLSNTFIDSISNGKLSLLFYKCEIKANDCSQCLSLNRQYSCMWCNINPILSSDMSRMTSDTLAQPSCRFMNAQSKLRAASQCISPLNTAIFAALNNQTNFANFNQCDKPQITDIQPNKLPIGGGTQLVINGVNLGSSKDDLISVNIICGSNSGSQNVGILSSTSSSNKRVTIKCDLMPLKYIPSKKIICKTRQSTQGVLSHCRVSVKLKSTFASKNGAGVDANSDENQSGGGLMNILVSG